MSCELTTLAVEVEVTSQLANRRCYGHRGKCYIALRNEAKHAREVLNLDRELLLALGSSLGVGIQRSSTLGKCSRGVLLCCEECYSLQTLCSNHLGCWCRVDEVVRVGKFAIKDELSRSRTVCSLGERVRCYAIDSNLVALTPIEWVDILSLCSDVSFCSLQRDCEGGLTCVLVELNAQVLGCVGNARIGE